MEYDFRLGDWVAISGTTIVGEITYIDDNAQRADVEWEEYDYIAADSFPFSSLTHINNKEITKK
jgi:hypothetical protein